MPVARRLIKNTGRRIHALLRLKSLGHIMSTSEHAAVLPSGPQFLKVSELAALLKVKPKTIYEMVAQRRIPFRKPPGSNILRFDLEEIIAWTKAGITK